MALLSTFVLAALGIFLLGKGSDWLTDSLVPLARRLKVTGTSLGLILVSASVSLPEILVAIDASVRGFPTISLGVVLGSIVCNIGLMTGLCAMIRPLPVSTTLLLRDGIFSIVVPILVFAVSSGGEITRLEGFAFLMLFLPYVLNVFLMERRGSAEQQQSRKERIEMELKLIGFDIGKVKAGWLSFGLGLSLLLLGAQLFGSALIALASQFGMNELLVGVTLGALGPSLPNVAAAYRATIRGMGEVAVSETLGSNIFTLLVTLGILAMLSPIQISPQWLAVDLPLLLLLSFLLFIFLVSRRSLSRLEGSILFGGYILTLILQILTAG